MESREREIFRLTPRCLAKATGQVRGTWTGSDLRGKRSFSLGHGDTDKTVTWVCDAACWRRGRG